MKLQQKLSKMIEAPRKQREGAKKTLERSQASHRTQLEECRVETSKIASALKKAEGLLETERFRFQQDKACLQDEMKNTVMAALKKVEQQLESRHIEWQENRSCLLEATEGLNLTLLERKQKWERRESSMRRNWRISRGRLLRKRNGTDIDLLPISREIVL